MIWFIMIFKLLHWWFKLIILLNHNFYSEFFYGGQFWMPFSLSFLSVLFYLLLEWWSVSFSNLSKHKKMHLTWFFGYLAEFGNWRKKWKKFHIRDYRFFKSWEEWKIWKNWKIRKNYFITKNLECSKIMKWWRKETDNKQTLFQENLIV